MKEASNHKCYTTQPQGKVPRFPLQCVTLSLILALLVILGVATFAYASDVSDAGYRGRITVANNGTANTSVSTIFTLNTQSLIDTNKLNSSANDCAIQTAVGTDVAFMPSVNSTYPWVTWVPTIGEDATLYQYLYTSGVTGGTLRYFPGSGGMTTTDSASLEPSDNATFEQTAYFNSTHDTSQNYYFAYKPNAWRIYRSGTGNITSAILQTGVWLTPLSTNATTWTAPNNAIDEDTGTTATEVLGGVGWSNTFEFNINPTYCESVRFWYSASGTGQVDLDAYYDGAWHNVSQGAETESTWVEKALGDYYQVSMARMRVYTSASSFYCRIYEFDFKGESDNVSVTASGVASGEPVIRSWLDEAYLHISIDGSESDNISLSGASIPNNSENWTFMQGVTYMDYNRIWVDGVLQQDISWEYATTFTDQSGNSHHATPTFRTASSDPDVSANLTSFTGRMETTPPPAAGQTGWDILPSVPASPSGFFGEFDPSSMTFWGSGYISTFSTATGIPLALIVFPYAFGIAIGAGFLAWYISSGGGKQHNRGSLLAMAATSLIFMLYFVYGAGGVIPGWILLPFAIEVLVFIVWRQTPSPF